MGPCRKTSLLAVIVAFGAVAVAVARPEMPPESKGSGWPEYDELARQIAEAHAELNTRHREVIAKYGRNDGAEARRILDPLVTRLHGLETRERALLVCEKTPVTDPGAMFAALKIRTSNMGAPDSESLAAYVETRVMDGSITPAQKARLFLVISLRTRGVMNPASKGAGQIAGAVAGTLRCFGVDKPGTGRPRGGGVVKTSEPLLLAKKHAADHRVALYHYHVKHIGNTTGVFAPIVVLPDGGTVLIGTKSALPPGAKYEIGKSRPVAIRLDPRGRVKWEKSLVASARRGFRDYEAASAARTADGGFVIYVLSYVHPARGSVARFVKLDARGKRVWERQLRGDGKVDTPFPSDPQLTARGTIAFTGHVYTNRAQTREMYAWEGELGRDGRILVDRIGGLRESRPRDGFGGRGYGGSTYGGAMYGGATYGRGFAVPPP